MSAVLYALLAITLPFTNSVEQFNDNKGWIPLTREEAYNNVRGNYIEENNAIENQWNSQVDSTDFHEDSRVIHKDNALKLVESQQSNNMPIYFEDHLDSNEDVDEDYTEDENDCGKQGVAKCPEEKLSTPTETSRHKNEVNNGLSTERTIRNAKKISEHNLAADNNIKNVNEKFKPIQEYVSESEPVEVKEQVDKEINRKSYEVVEEPDSKDLVNEEQKKTEEKNGYIYTTPKIELASPKQNLTTKFIDILSKYNIRTDDKLPNYDLSRLHKNQNQMQNLFLPIPMRYPYKYNSLNHLPVDPLIAVFLSNYGFYLPWLYRHHNNYRNLYGYLASNSIHNNKPFGLYKVFSDTDSSH